MDLDAPESMVCQELGAPLVLISSPGFTLPLELVYLSSAHVHSVGKN